MKPQTLSSYRQRKSIKLFKSIFDKKPTDIEFILKVDDNGAVFKVFDNVDEIFALFYDNDLMTYADSLDYFVEEEQQWTYR